MHNLIGPTPPVTNFNVHIGNLPPGICGISAEMLKAEGFSRVTWLSRILRKAWDSGVTPEDWKKDIIIPFYKGRAVIGNE